MKAYVLMFLVVLVPTAAAFDWAGLSNICAAAANVFFLVAPITFAVGSLIGLLSRRRA